MATIKITRKGREIGVLETGKIGKALLEGESRWFVVVTEVDEAPVAAIIFRRTGNAIELDQPLLWVSEQASETERERMSSKRLIQRVRLEEPSLLEVIGSVSVSRKADWTEFSFQTDSPRAGRQSWLRLRIDEESEDGFSQYRFHWSEPFGRASIRGRLYSRHELIDIGAEFILRGEGSFGIGEAYFRGKYRGGEYRFESDSFGSARGYGRARFEAFGSTGFPLLWLLQKTISGVPVLKTSHLRIRVGFMRPTLDDLDPTSVVLHKTQPVLLNLSERAVRRWSWEGGFGGGGGPGGGGGSGTPGGGGMGGGIPGGGAMGGKKKKKKRRAISARKAKPRSAAHALLKQLATGKFPKTEVRRESRAKAKNPVDCSVFAPDRVERNRKRLLQVFLHAPEDRARVAAEARTFDRETEERGHRSLLLDAPIGAVFLFDVEIEGFVLKQRMDSVIWTGHPQVAAFPFEVPKDSPAGQHPGTVWITKDGTPVGRISFQIEVVSHARGARSRPTGEEARHYRACFCSYSSLDRVEMLKRAQGLRATGLQTFIDVLNLRPGDKWNPKIFGAIDDSDLFVLIWSKNALGSKWVRREARHALTRYKQHRSPDFRPIPVEGPPIAPVPPGLRTHHFNDEMLYLIRAAELEASKRKQRKSKARRPKESN